MEDTHFPLFKSAQGFACSLSFLNCFLRFLVCFFSVLTGKLKLVEPVFLKVQYCFGSCTRVFSCWSDDPLHYRAKVVAERRKPHLVTSTTAYNYSWAARPKSTKLRLFDVLVVIQLHIRFSELRARTRERDAASDWKRGLHMSRRCQKGRTVAIVWHFRGRFSLKLVVSLYKW